MIRSLSAAKKKIFPDQKDNIPHSILLQLRYSSTKSTLMLKLVTSFAGHIWPRSSSAVF